MRISDGVCLDLENLKRGFIVSMSANPKMKPLNTEAGGHDYLKTTQSVLNHFQNSGALFRVEKNLAQEFNFKCLTEFDKIYLLIQKKSNKQEATDEQLNKDPAFSMICPNLSCIEFSTLEEIKMKFINAQYFEMPYNHGVYSYFRFQEASGKHFIVRYLTVNPDEAEDLMTSLFMFLNELNIHKKYLEHSRKCANLVGFNNMFVEYTKSNPAKSPTFYMIFEDFHTSLRDIIEYRRMFMRPFSLKEILDVLQDLALGLKTLHGLDICHRNLKPESVMYNHETKKFMIFDLSVASVGDTAGASMIPCLIGTALYMSVDYFTEFNINKRRVNFMVNPMKCDIYSLGVIAVELMAQYLTSLQIPSCCRRFYSAIRSKKLGDLGDLLKLAEEKLKLHLLLVDIIEKFQEKTDRGDICDIVRSMLEVDTERRLDVHGLLNKLESLDEFKRGTGIHHIVQFTPAYLASQGAGNNSGVISSGKDHLSRNTLEITNKGMSKTIKSITDNESYYAGEDFNLLAAKEKLKEHIVDFKNVNGDFEDYSTPSFHLARVLTHLNLFEKAVELMQICETHLSSKPNSNKNFRVRVGHLHVNNLKMLNKKEEALVVVKKLIEFLKKEGNEDPGVMFDTLMQYAHILYLTNRLTESLECLSQISAQIERDRNGSTHHLVLENRRYSVAVITAKIHMTLYNHRKAYDIVMQQLELRRPEHVAELSLLKCQILLEADNTDVCKADLLKIERGLDTHKKEDFENLVLIYSMLFYIGCQTNDPKLMVHYRDAMKHLISQKANPEKKYLFIKEILMGLNRMEQDLDSAGDHLEKAAALLDDAKFEQLGTKTFMMKLFLFLLYHCKWKQRHIEYIDQVLVSIQTQTCVNHFTTFEIQRWKIDFLQKINNYQLAKKLAMELRMSCMSNEVEEKSFLFDINMTLPRLLYYEGRIFEAWTEFHYVFKIQKELQKNRQVGYEQLAAVNSFDLNCANWRFKCQLKLAVDNAEGINKLLLQEVEKIRLSSGNDTDQTCIGVYNCYFKSLFMLVKSNPSISQQKLGEELIANDMIKLVNASKDSYVKLKGLYLISEFHAMKDNFKECDVYLEKAFFLIQNDQILKKRSSELMIKYQSRAAKMLAHYLKTFSKDTNSVLDKVEKLLKALSQDIKSKRSATVNTLFYLQARYRRCCALKDIDDLRYYRNEDVQQKFRELYSDFKVHGPSYWRFWTGYHLLDLLLKQNNNGDVFQRECQEIAHSLTDDAKVVFGPSSPTIKMVDDLLKHSRKT